ncbi:MAG: GNAT family N-acetyltransferase [Loktanella sp.]|nr:GNAT family N-acetyltransferase [Loktanella sp.]
MNFDPITLTGQHMALVPLDQSHHDGLVAAVQDGELWKLWYTAIPDPAGMSAEIDRRLGLQAAGTMQAWIVVDRARGRIVGMTSFLNIDRTGPRVEIGATFYAASAQRSAVNTEAKLLLLTHAFDTLDCLAVEFRTHAMNQQSRRAIERLGAKLDGTLRQHLRLPDGSLRDTCVYSIVASEWPTVRRSLQWRLQHA